MPAVESIYLVCMFISVDLFVIPEIQSQARTVCGCLQQRLSLECLKTRLQLSNTSFSSSIMT